MDWKKFWEDNCLDTPLFEDAAEAIWDAATAAEREACAEICDELKSMDYCVDVRQAADAIRKRSNLTGEARPKWSEAK